MPKYKILMVEDDAIESMDIQRRLKSLGYEVPYIASRGEEAIEKAKEIMPDLILMDISLKGDMDGIEVAEHLLHLDIPIIYLTAHSDEATVQKAKHTQPYGYLIKPYDPNELRYALELAIYKSKNDKKLKESEAVSRALLNASNDSVFLVDDKSVFLAVNETTCQRLGFSEKELIGHSFKEFINPELAESRWEYFKTAMETKKSVEFEDTRDGIMFHHRITPIIEDGSLRKLAVFGRDITDKKISEQKIIESEKKYRTIFDHAGSATLLFDDTGLIHMVNSEWKKISGYSQEEVEDKMKWMDFVHPDYRDLMIEYHQKRESGDPSVPSRYESCFIKKNGDLLSMYVSVTAMPEKNQWLASAIDITDLKKAQKDLSLSEERLKMALQSANAALFDWDLPSGNAYFSPEYYEMFGYDVDEFTANYDNWVNIIHPDDREKTISDLNKQLKEKSNLFKVEYRVVCKDSSIKWISGVAKGVEFDEKGVATRLIGMNQNITERKNLEEKLKLAQFTVDHGPESIIWITSDARILFVNEAACESLGYSYKELTSMTVFDIDPDFPTAEWERHWEDIKSGKIKTLETQHLRKNGEKFYVNIVINYVQYHGKEYNCAFVRDVTEQKETENDLKENRRMLETLISNVPGVVYRCENDRDWTMKFISAGCLQLTGYNVDDLIDNAKISYGSLIHPKDRKQVWSEIQIALDKQEPFEIKYRIFTSESRIKTVWERGRGVFSSDGKVLFLEGFIEDVSMQEVAEAELIESKNYLNSIINTIADPVFVKDRSHNWILINNSFCEFIGKSREELIGKSDYEFFPAHEADVFWEKDEEVFKTRQENVNEEEITTSNGETRKIITKKTVYNDKSGEIYLVGVIRDITDLKSAEQFMKDQYNFLQNLMDSIPSPIFYKDINYKYQGCNKAFEKALGITLESIKDKTVYDLNPKELADKFHEKDKKLFDNPGTQKYEAPVKYADGTLHKILFIKNTFKDHQGNLAGMIGIMWDISDIKKIEKALKISELKFKEIFENINTAVAVYEVKDDGKTFVFKDFNRAGSKIEKISREEVIGRNLIEVFPNVEEFGILDVLKRVWKTGTPERFPVAFYQDERISGWRENYIYRLPSGEIVAVYDDLTKEKQAEEALKNSEREYRAIFENTGSATFISEDNMILSLVNQEFADLVGYSKEEIENKLSWTEFYVEEQLERMKEYHHLRRIGPNKAPKNYESQIKTKKGDLLDVYISVAIIPGTKKSLVSMLDITEKKQSRIKLRRELKINQSLARIYSPIISPESTIEDITVVILEEAQNLTDSVHGYVSTIDPLTGNNVGHSLTRMMPECGVVDEAQRIIDLPINPDSTYNGLWGHSLNTGKPFFTNSPEKHPSSKGIPEGHIELERFLSIPVFLGNKLVGQIAVANSDRDYNQRDIEALERIAEFYALAIQSKNAEKELKDSLEEKKTLLREIHHRVKNNMQIISSLLNLEKEWDSERDPLEIITNSQNRIKFMSLIHELLYQSESLSKVDFKLYIERITHYLFIYYSIGTKIKLSMDLEEQYLNIETAVPCGLIINELVTNSLKHAFPSKDGEINISFHQLNSKYRLIVKDNGIGLPKDLDIKKTTTLGLYLVNNLVNQIDGSLEANGEEGTEFIITFKELEYQKRF